MGEDASTGRPAMSQNPEPDQLREEIAETRQELGDTVEALAAKTDVKAQAKQKVEEGKTAVSRNPAPLIAAGAATLSAAGAWLIIKHRRAARSQRRRVNLPIQLSAQISRR